MQRQGSARRRGPQATQRNGTPLHASQTGHGSEAHLSDAKEPDEPEREGLLEDDAESDAQSKAHKQGNAKSKLPLPGWLAKLVARDDAMELAALVVGRGFVSAGFSLVLVASPQLLLEINQGDHAAAENVRALIETINTVTGLLSRSLIGNFIDSYGRLPALIIGPALSAAARLLVAVYPSNGAYILYRVINMFSLMPLMQAFTASLADRLGGRGSDDYAEVNRYTWMFLATVRMAVLNLSRTYRVSIRRSFILAALANAGAAIFFFLFVHETLRPKDRRPFNARRAANPFSFVAFFNRSKALRTLACVTLLTSIPLYNGTTENFRSQRFNWKMKENAQMHQIMNVVEIVSPFYSMHIMKALGRKRTTVMRQWMFVLTNLNTALARDGRMLALNPFLSSLFDEGAFETLVARAGDNVDAGQGELSSAMMNLRFPLGLTLPIFFSRLFSHSSKWSTPWLRGTVPFWLCAIIHVLNAAFVLPLCWDSIMEVSPSRSEKKDR
ncbi:Hypothetical Protein FCC1311_008462 [Hondaea fermentalgiana]|uniref:Uncharacterized protein n=1 Tax=Hondaea fermentalgiana TaxID=2315210 RepID=A0A2R5G0T4_9STRA|nr:Hypothetical Protein FCC1311_008462 [Hondaea fermentalgiana]|eukprot:GBG24627.1 Hypothetical Protein FCC1311_008462 [Hondaea fermentalgiana]